MDFLTLLNSSTLVKSVEVVPPKIDRVSEQLDQIADIADLLDFVTVTDNARGHATINAITYAHYIKRELDIAVIPHITPRDRNVLALKSDIYAALLLDLDGFFAIGGDIIESREVRELDTLALISMIRDIEYEHSIKKPIGASLFHTYSREKMLEKRAKGSDFFITQGIMELNHNLSRLIDEFGNMTIAGFIIPRSKSFLQNYRSMGLDVSDSTIKKLLNATDFDDAVLRHSVALIDRLKPKIAGVHIMPINNFRDAKKLLEVL